jgi:hypothetical protein
MSGRDGHGSSLRAIEYFREDGHAAARLSSHRRF